MIARLAFASLRKRRGSFLGTFLAATAAVALLSTAALLMYSAFTSPSDDNRFAAADVMIASPHSITGTLKTGDKTKVKTKPLIGAATLPATLTAQLKAIAGVSTVTPDTTFPVQLLTAQHIPIQAAHHLPILAHNWSAAQLTPFSVAHGHAPGMNQVALDIVLARNAGLAPGDTIQLLTKTGIHTMQVSGTVSMGGGRTLASQATIFVADSDVSPLSQLAGPTAIGITASAHNASETLLNKLHTVTNMPVYATSQRELADIPTARTSYTPAISLFGIMGGLTVFEAIFVLSGTTAFAARQRLHELALLRLIGATPKQLRRLLSYETLVVSIVAWVLGSSLATQLAKLVAGRLRELGTVPEQFSVHTNALLLLGGGLIAVVATQIAVRLASKRTVDIAPTQAFSESAIETKNNERTRHIIGTVLLLGGIAVLMFGPLGSQLMGMGMAFIATMLLLCGVAAWGPSLARPLIYIFGQFLKRVSPTASLAAKNLRSQATLVAGIALPLTLLLSANAVPILDAQTMAHVAQRQQQERTASADTIASAQEVSGLPQSFIQSVQSLPAVDSIAAQTPTTVYTVHDGKPQHYPAQGVLVHGTTPPLDLGLLRGRLADLADKTVLVSKNVAANNGWSFGQTVNLQLADGTAIKPRIVGMFTRTAGFGDFALPAISVIAHDPQGLFGFAAIRSHQSAHELAKQLSSLRNRFPLFKLTQATVSAQNESSLKTQAGAVEIFIGVSVVFTAIAVCNTFAISTMGRRRDFTNLRLAGALPRQVRSMMLWEAALVVLVALTIGCAIISTIVGAFSLAQSGQWNPVVNPAIYSVMIIGTALLGIVASLIPARLILQNRRLSTPSEF